MHKREEFDYRRLCDALIETMLPFSVFHDMDWYTTFIDVVHYHCMGTDRNEWQVKDRIGELQDTAFAGLGKCWNPWGGCSAHNCCLVGEVTGSLFV